VIGGGILSAIMAAISFAGGIAKAVGAYFGWQRDQALREDGARQVAETLRGKTEEIKRVSDEIDARPMPDSWRGVADRLRKRNKT
jgi:hypothetical protein